MRQIARAALAVTVLLAAGVLAPPASATSIRPPKNLGQLARIARAIVLARAADTRVEDRGLPVRVTTFDLVEHVAGARVRAMFEVEVPGGRIDEHRAVVVDGAPRFEPGRTYLLFLAPTRAHWRPQMLAYGILEETADGKLLLPVPEARQLLLVDRDSEPVAVYDAAALVVHLRRVALGARWDRRRVEAPYEVEVLQKALTGKPLACAFQSDAGDGLPLRKFGYETGATMSIYHTTPGQNGITDGGLSAVQQGTGAWTNHADSVIRFSYAGTRARAIACSGGSDVDEGGVVYNDPCNEITDLVGCVGTLAFGGSFYDPSQTKLHDGDPWHDVTTPFVVVNNGSECVGQTKFKTMMTHELGHTQGFGHHTDPSATMAAVLPNDSRGAALALTDQQCASYSYHTFVDVPYRYFAWRFIEAVENAGIDTGCGSGNFCPSAPMTRGQMAVWLLRARFGSAYTPPACSAPLFADVPCSNPLAPWINDIARRGITAGCGGGNYCPNTTVTRGQMTVFVLTTRGVSPPACTVPRFSDVPCSSPFAPFINEAAREGITAGCSATAFCPETTIDRDQMAVFVATAFSLALPPAPPP